MFSAFTSCLETPTSTKSPFPFGSAKMGLCCSNLDHVPLFCDGKKIYVTVHKYVGQHNKMRDAFYCSMQIRNGDGERLCLPPLFENETVDGFN